MKVADCHRCKKRTEYYHKHDTAHGITGTHMAGSERYECKECGCTIFAADKIDGFNFILDTAASKGTGT
jgi:hypothetical protein